MSYVQLSEGGFKVVYPLGLWSRFPGVVNVDSDMASKLFTFTFTLTPHTSALPLCDEATAAALPGAHLLQLCMHCQLLSSLGMRPHGQQQRPFTHSCQ